MKFQLFATLTLTASLLSATGCEKEPATPADAVAPQPTVQTIKTPETKTVTQAPDPTPDASTPEVVETPAPVIDQPAVEEPVAVAVPELPEYDSLHDVMEDLADSFRHLRRYTESGEADELLSHAAKIRALIGLAKTMTPDQVERAEGAEREQLASAYQTHMKKVGPALDAYDAAIRANDREAAAAAVSQLHDAEEAGHEALGVEDH